MADQLPAEDNLELRIDAQVVKQLGAELITDPEQALIELIKNAFDADALNCRVVIDTKTTEHFIGEDRVTAEEAAAERTRQANLSDEARAKEEADGTLQTVSDLTGNIIVENDGPGVDADTIRKRWLLISGSFKRPKPGEKKAKTDGQRTPIGDKGIGRLGTMRLGDRIEFTSRLKDAKVPAEGVVFRWSSFEHVQTLDQVPVHMVKSEPTADFTTRVVITGLQEATRWKAGTSQLQANLARLISPFTSEHEMAVTVRLNKEVIELQRIANSLDTYAAAWYDFKFSTDHRLTLTAKFAAPFFGEKWSPAKAEEFLRYFTKTYPTFGLNRVKERNQWIFQLDRSLDCKAIKGYQSAQSPGPFSGGIYSISFNALPPEKDEERVSPRTAQLDGTEVTPPTGGLKELIKGLSGVTIYRHGFGIRLNPDWLNLSAGSTSGTSYYGLRKTNTVGYIDIDAEHNASLVETSNRESFLDTPAWRQFNRVCSRTVDEINSMNQALRRTFGEFVKEGAIPEDGPQTPAQAFEILDEQAKFVKTLQGTLQKQTQAVAQVSKLAKQLPKGNAEVASLQKDLEASLKDMEELLSRGDRAVPKKDNAARDVLAYEIERLQDRTTAAYDFISAGLAAEHFAHEVNPILVKAIDALTDAEKAVQAKRPVEAVVERLQAVRGYLRVIIRYLSTLDPMLRVYREIKDKIGLAAFAQDYAAGAKDRLEKEKITLKVTVKKDATVMMPRGRLMQVFDNLVRNSEYWLSNAAVGGADFKREIYIEIDASQVTFWDNGLGVRPEIEDQIFQMFVTDKPRQEGRGLGLFIIREILTRFKCSINLSPDRNGHGRRYRFEVDLASVTK